MICLDSQKRERGVFEKKMSMCVVMEPEFASRLEMGNWNESYTKDEVEKLKQAIEVHGYRGASKKKHNGVVPIRPSDSNLFRVLKSLTEKLSPEDQQKCHQGIPIKAVAHVPSGWRMIGYLCQDESLFMLGMANYDRKIK